MLRWFVTHEVPDGEAEPDVDAAELPLADIDKRIKAIDAARQATDRTLRRIDEQIAARSKGRITRYHARS